MANHWESAADWDKATEEEEEEGRHDPLTSPGSFHCKSALRSHDSNMKLFLYRRSYNRMRSMTGSASYNEDVVLLLPDLWSCFYDKTHGLDRVLDVSKSRSHRQASPAFTRWADTTLSPILEGSILSDVIRNEAHIWQYVPDWIRTFQITLYPTIIDRMKFVLYLVYFVNLTLLVLNHKTNHTRPDIGIKLPGIITEEDEELYKIKYNDYLCVYIYNECVRFVTPIFDQIMQKDIYLNLCDKLNERMNVMLGSSIITYAACHGPDDDENYDIHLNKAVHQIIKWGDNLLYQHKNHAYSLLGKFEAYCVSAIIKRDDPKIWKNDEFQTNLLTDDLENQVELHGAAVSLCNILDGLHEAVLAEVHGLWRIWGHPIIDLEGGLKKMEATCTKTHNISTRETLIGTRTFKLTFSKNYYSKHNHYPLTNITDHATYEGYSDNLKERDRADYILHRDLYNATSYVHRCLRQNEPIRETCSEYSHSDWDSVHFLQSFQIPQSINLATMIKDKAISQTRTELIESASLRNSVFDPTKRRGVLKWLSEQTIRLKDYLSRIDENGLAEDDRIIGLYPKERELKPKARFFSLMSYNMRMYITATEELLGKYLLPYFPMITMSDTLLSMIIRLFNMTTKIGASGTKVTYSMNIDFSKWNQNMREATNAGIFSEIDRIVGFRRLISRTHDIFRTSYLYLCSGEYIPRIIQRCLTTISPYSRTGDESGKEGLRQKGWTITTVCDILSLAFLHNVRIELIGGGDNQVLTIEIHSQGKNLLLSDEEQLVKIKERMNRFRNALAKKMEKRGLPLKLEETWISHRLLMYNKIMYLSGVPLPGRLKVISRMFSNSNEGILTLGNITSTLGTGFQSLSSKDYDPSLAWIISRIMTLISVGQYYLANPVCGTRRLDQQILRVKWNIKNDRTHFGDSDDYWHPKQRTQLHASQDHSLSFVELYLVCLYYHKILGGPGIGTPLSYIMKGFPDPLSEALAFNYSILSRVGPGGYHNIVTNLTSVKKAEVMHWEHLLEDPVSINHDAPAHGVAALREQAEQILKSADIKNVKFKELISLGDTEYLRSLSEQLCSPDEIEPRLLHDIVGSTIPGYVNTILSKVDQSSTLGKLAINADVVTSVYTSEIEYYMYLANKVHTKSGHTFGECPTEDARALRNSTWKRRIVGVTTPHPMSFLEHLDHANGSPVCDHNYISVIVKRPFSHYKVKRGDFKPYFGSYTQEKFKSGILSSAYGDEDILKRSLKIQKLLGWRFKVGSTMYNIIQGILRCVTDSDPDKFLPTPEEITGDVEHRYHDMATKHGGIPSNLIKYYTYVSCNTTTFVDHSKGAANESLHFQAAIIYCCMIAIMKTKDDPMVTRVLHFHESCRQCIKPIITSSNDGGTLRDIKLISCPSNELMFIEEKDIPIHYHNHIAFLRGQQKQRTTIVNQDDKVEFTLPQERISWLVLVCASLLNTQGKMKRSAMKLTISSLHAVEAVYVIKNMAIVTMLREGVPWGSMDATSYTDLYLQYRDVVDTMCQSSQLSDYLLSLGIIPTDDIMRVGGFLMLLNEISTRDLDDATVTAVAKYQDPEYYNSRLLICSKKNPSLKTCPVCAKNFRDNIKDSLNKLCGIHGELNTATKYHLYSLDKLARYKGAYQHARDTTLGTMSKKRKRGSIFEYMDIAAAADSGRSTKRRKSGFLFSANKKDKYITSILRPTWIAQAITIDGTDSSDTVMQDACMQSYVPALDTLPNHISKVVTLASSLLQIIRDNRQRQIRPHADSLEEINIALEVVPDSQNHMFMARALSIINKILISESPCVYIFHLYCGQCNTLEDMDFRYLELMVVNYKTLIAPMSSVVQIRVTDDTSLDILRVTHGKDIVVVRSTEAAEYISGNYYLMSSNNEVYNQVSKIDLFSRGRSRGHDICIMQPSVTSLSPYPVILYAKSVEAYQQVSDTLLLSALSDNIPTWSPDGCSLLIQDLANIDGISIYHDLYRKLITTKSGITCKSSYESVISKLSGGIYGFALKANQSATIPWRCMTIIRLMICIKILTDEEEEEALKYYSACNSVSFKRGTYKIIQLHRGSLAKRERRQLINWTRGSFGSELPSAVEDVRGWLYVSWKSAHDKLPYLLI